MMDRVMREQDVPGPGGAPVVGTRTEIVVACTDASPRLSAVVVGAIVGFAAMIVLGTVGSALGATAGTIAERKAQKERDKRGESAPGVNGGQTDDLRNPTPAQKETREGAAKGIGLGAAIWSVLTMFITGFVGGWATGRLVHFRRRGSWILGVATWSAGVLILLTLLAMGVSGGLGAGMNQVFNATPPSDVRSEDLQAAGMVTSAALWALLISEVIGLGSTIWGVRKGIDAHARAEVVSPAVA